MLITDVASGEGLVPAGQWYVATDQVMGGVSEGGAVVEHVEGRAALRLTGEVSSANNGGFLLLGCRFGREVDASGFGGLEVDVRGVGGGYVLSLRTADLSRPWQSYRAPLEAGDGAWHRMTVPFSAFTANKTDAPLNPTRLTRLAIVATEKDAPADVALSRVAFID
ncbi:CIA30 family protein [Caenispirillum salinarum]|uniref:CIA30 family protein n=1 Tax=Caenispirillum salinarum TaxID=859058 RepID=UPI00384F1972